jgi:hypothetical protein
LASTPKPVFTSVWKGSDSVISSRSSRALRASFRSSMFSVVTSNNVRSARVRDRTNELKTSNSRDNGADHGCGLEQNTSSGTCQKKTRSSGYRAPTLKFKGTMLSTLITRSIHDFSSSENGMIRPINGENDVRVTHTGTETGTSTECPA